MISTCTSNGSELFRSGEFMQSMACFFTQGGDPTLSVAVPLFMWAAILLAFYIATGSLVMPAVIGIIFAGVIFVSLPASATTIALVAILTLLSLGGLLLSLRAQAR